MAIELQKTHPGTIKFVRYEDLSILPSNVTKDILQFLNLPMTAKVSEFIDTHTKVKENKKKVKAYGTIRDSEATAFAWRDKLGFDDIKNIQETCSKAMEKLGYVIYNNKEDIKKSPIVKYDDLNLEGENDDKRDTDGMEEIHGQEEDQRDTG